MACLDHRAKDMPETQITGHPSTIEFQGLYSFSPSKPIIARQDPLTDSFREISAPPLYPPYSPRCIVHYHLTGRSGPLSHNVARGRRKYFT